MKHLIITAITCVALVGHSAGVAISSTQPTNGGQFIASTPTNTQINSQQLSAREMETAVGGDITGCWSYVDGNGDEHGICCADLWLFTICFGVNLSAIERLLDF